MSDEVRETSEREKLREAVERKRALFAWHKTPGCCDDDRALLAAAESHLARMDAAEGEDTPLDLKPLASRAVTAKIVSRRVAQFDPSGLEPEDFNAAAREHGGPASEEEIARVEPGGSDLAWAFREGVRWAERHHAITGERAQPAVSEERCRELLALLDFVERLLLGGKEGAK